MQITFALISGGRWPLLRRCLESLEFCQHPRWIICPSQPPREIQNLLRPSDQIFVVSAVNVSAQRNFVLRRCTTDYIYFLDEDCRFGRQPPDPLVARWFSNEIHAAGGFYKNPASIGLSGKIYNHMTNLWLERVNSKHSKCLVGGNFILRCKGLDILFDESLSFGGEEIDFFARLDGEILLHHDFDVEHFAQHSFFDLFRRAQRHGSQPVVTFWLRPSLRFWRRFFGSPGLSLGAITYFLWVRFRNLFVSGNSNS